MKKVSLKQKNNKILYVAGILVLVLVIFQLLADVTFYRSLFQERPDYGSVFANLVIDATEQLNKPAPVNPVSGQVYIPEAHLVMPAYTGLGQIEYLYETGQYASNNSTEIHLTSSVILGLAKNQLWIDVANANNRNLWQTYTIEDSTRSIPSLQACTRGVQLFFVKQNLGGDFVFRGSHKLNDGRTLFVYSESNCKQDQTPVIALANKAQSY